MHRPPSHADRTRDLERRIARLRPRLEALTALSARLAWARLAVVLGGAALAVVAFLLDHPAVFVAALIATPAVFLFVVRRHARVDTSAARHAAALALHSANLARARLDWDALPESIGADRRPDHPYEGDLDIVGERSLLRLVDTTVSREGAARLREWLTVEAPDAARIAARQAVVRELIPRAWWRGRLALGARLAAGADGRWDTGRLVHWVEGARVVPGRRRWVALLAVLGLVNLVLVAAYAAAGSPQAGALLRVTVPVYIVLYAVAARGMGDPFNDALDLEALLRALGEVFGRLERTPYHDAPHLAALGAPFRDPAGSPSTHRGRVSRVLALSGLRGNPFVWLILNAGGPWDLAVTDMLDRCRVALGRDLPRWLDAWYDLEALGALANLAWLNPEYTLPEVASGAGEAGAPVFDARGLGHPLIPVETKVRNDLAFGRLGEIAIVTGSNMAGKSTFLRTVGMNLALAQAGGPVDARHLATVPVRLFTCIRVSDSVTGGTSYFYAEVKRLRALLAALEADAQRAEPLCFLIDEIFRGTNNRERLIGSRAYVRALARGRGMGLIATHDLELVALADEIPAVRNLHFRDDVSGGRMTFDYLLRPGPCPTTNALRIMRLAGLPQ